MARYLATQIKNSKFDYDKVIKKFPQYEKEINKILAAEGLLDKYKKN